jgi:hypothetical protein
VSKHSEVCVFSVFSLLLPVRRKLRSKFPKKSEICYGALLCKVFPIFMEQLVIHILQTHTITMQEGRLDLKSELQRRSKFQLEIRRKKYFTINSTNQIQFNWRKRKHVSALGKSFIWLSWMIRGIHEFDLFLFPGWFFGRGDGVWDFYLITFNSLLSIWNID